MLACLLLARGGWLQKWFDRSKRLQASRAACVNRETTRRLGSMPAVKNVRARRCSSNNRRVLWRCGRAWGLEIDLLEAGDTLNELRQLIAGQAVCDVQFRLRAAGILGGGDKLQWLKKAG